MKEKTKKILMFVGFIGFVIVVAFLIYIVFFKPTKINTPVDNGNVDNNTGNFPVNTSDGYGITNQNNGGNTIINNGNNVGTNNISGEVDNIKNNTDVVADITNIANGGITRGSLVSDKNNSSTTISGNNLLSFDSTDGGFYKIDLESGNRTLLTQDKFKGASNIVWAPTDSVAVIEFPDGSNVSYDFNKDKQYVLPQNWYDFSFQKDGEKLAFMTDSNNYDNRWLSVANIDGSGFKALEPLGNNADKVDVMYSPNEQIVALSRTGEPVGTFQQKVLLVGLNGENFEDLLIEGRGFNPLWTKKGDKVIYDAYNKESNYNPNIWVVNATAESAGTGSKSLNLKTWVNKCGFNSTGTLVYCAVPRELPDGAGMFPDMMDEAEIYDDIYVVNIYTGYKKIVAKPETDVSISKIIISDDDKTLYYQDKFSGAIYSIKL